MKEKGTAHSRQFRLVSQSASHCLRAFVLTSDFKVHSSKGTSDRFFSLLKGNKLLKESHWAEESSSRSQA